MTVNWNRQNFGDQNPEKHPAVEVLRRDMPEAVLEVASSCGEVWAVVSADHVLEVLRLLKDNEELAYDHLSDLTAVHWPRRRGAEFDLVYQLYSIRNRSRFRVKVPLPEGQEAKTACGLWIGADWLEREVFDMFGINFAGHPDQRRILNPDGFDGYPLRKDFPLRGRVRW